MRALALFGLVACASGPSPETARWPSHRHHHDDQLEVLQKKTQQLEEHISELEARITKLEAPPSAQ